MKKTTALGDRLHSKNNKDLIKLYSILFVFIALIIFFPFLYMNQTLLTTDDGFLQHFSTLKKLRNMVSQVIHGGGIPFWSWDLGLGSDTTGALATVIFDPFCYIAAAFPPQYHDISYTLTIILQMYVAGLAFIGYANAARMTKSHALWGSIAYAFSAWVMQAALHHNGFVTVAICFALLMMGVEKVFQGESPVVLILAATASAITYFYFAYMSAIMIFLYLIVRYFTDTKKKTFQGFAIYMLRFVGYVIAAACLSLPVILPVIYILQCAPKSAATTFSIFFDIKIYVQYFSVLLTEQELFGNYSSIAVVPLFLIMLPVMFRKIQKKEATPAMIMLLISFIMLLLPICNSIMNGGSYPVGRWCYAATFFFIVGGIQCLSDSYIQSPQFRKATCYLLLFLGVWTILICRILLGLLNETSILIASFNLLCAYIFLSLIQENKIRNRKSSMITLLLIVNILGVYTIRFSPSVSQTLNNYVSVGTEYEKMMTSTQKSATAIKDTSFYRTDQIDTISLIDVPENSEFTNTSYRPAHTPANESMYFGTRSLYTYLSTTQNTLFSFYKVMGNNAGYYRRICTYSNDNRTRLDFLMGVKYFLGNNPKNNLPTGANEFAPYGFKNYMTTKEGVEILRNKYSIGLGCTFDSYITETELETLSYPDREQALMEHVVLPDNASTDLFHGDPSSISAGSKSVAFDVKQMESVSSDDVDFLKNGNTNAEKTFTVDDMNGSVVLDVTENVKNSEIYVYFHNLKRIPKSKKSAMEENQKVKNNPVLAFKNWFAYSSYKDYGNFSVIAEKNSIVKKAINSIGDVQGFSDIEDYMLNMGDYKDITGEIKLSFETAGTYTYDSFEIIAVPISTYKREAKNLQTHKFRQKTVTDDYLKGTVQIDSPSIVYLSVPYNPGWKVYIDGQQCKDVTIADYNFTGIPLSETGTHTIELRYRPVGFTIGVIGFFAGTVMTIFLGIYFYIRRKRS